MSIDLGRIGFSVVIDDSQALPTLRGAYAKLQAEADQLRVKVPLTTDAGGSNGRPSTFSTAQAGVPGVGPVLASSGGSFAVNKPVTANSGFAYVDRGGRVVTDYQVAAIQGRMQQTGSSAVDAREAAIMRSFNMRAAREAEAIGARVDRNWDAAAMAQQKQDERSSAGGGFGFPARLAVTMGLLGAHELIRANIAMQRGAFESATAGSRADQLRAEVNAARTAYSGFFGSIIGAGRDLFGMGPESMALDADRTIALSGSQDRLRSTQLAASFGPAMRAAAAGGDDYAGRRARIERDLAISTDEKQRAIQFRQSRLQDITATTTQNVEFGGASAISPGLGGGRVSSSTSYSFALQGSERATVQNELRSLQVELDQLQKDAAAQIQGLDREIRLTRSRLRNRASVSFATVVSELFEGGSRVGPEQAQMRADYGEMIDAAPESLKPGARLAALAGAGAFGARTFSNALTRARGAFTDAVSMRMRGASAELAATGRPLDAQMADIEAQRSERAASIREQYRDAPALRWMMLGAMNAQMNSTRAAMQANFDFGTSMIDRQLGTERRIAQARLESPRINPAAIEAIGIAGAGLGRADELRRGGRPQQARESLQNTLLDLQATKQDFLASFKARQIDLRDMSITNPADQTNPAEVLKSIKNQMGEIKDAIKALASD